MAKTYGGYVPRDISKTKINWAEATKKLADTITTKIDARVEKKRAIDVAKNEFLQKIDSVPQGMDEEYNKFVMDGGNAVKSGMLEAYYLLRGNKLSPDDYNLISQNANTGASNLVKTVNNYNKFYGERLEREMNGKAHPVEAWYTEQSNKFATFKDSKINFNPLTGQVGLDYIDPETGAVTKKSLNALDSSITTTIDKLNPEKVMTDLVKASASKYEIVDPAGELKTIDDLSQMEGWENADGSGIFKTMRMGLIEDDMLGSQLLMNGAIGGNYRFTENPDEVDTKHADYDPNAILLVEGTGNLSVPQLTEKQKEDLDAQYYKPRMEAMFGRKETPKAEKSDSPTPLTTSQQEEINRKKKLKIDTANANAIADIAVSGYQNDPALLQEVQNYISTLPTVSPQARWTVDMATGDLIQSSPDGIGGWNEIKRIAVGAGMAGAIIGAHGHSVATSSTGTTTTPTATPTALPPPTEGMTIEQYIDDNGIGNIDEIKVNGQPAVAGYTIQANDVITTVPTTTSSTADLQRLQDEIRHVQETVKAYKNRFSSTHIPIDRFNDPNHDVAQKINYLLDSNNNFFDQGPGGPNEGKEFTWSFIHEDVPTNIRQNTRTGAMMPDFNPTIKGFIDGKQVYSFKFKRTNKGLLIDDVNSAIMDMVVAMKG